MSRRSPLPDRHGVIRIATMLVVMALLLALPGTALAQDGELVPVSELLEDGARFDNVTITVEGELVGDYGFRDDGVMWTQINDDSYARDALVDGGPRTGANVGIGVRMPSALGENLDPVGGYRLEGPLVQLTGVWRYHDPNRGGESYLDVGEYAEDCTAPVGASPGRGSIQPAIAVFRQSLRHAIDESVPDEFFAQVTTLRARNRLDIGSEAFE